MFPIAHDVSGPDDFPDNNNNKFAQRTLVVGGPLSVSPKPTLLLTKGLFTWREGAPANRATLGEPTFHTFP